MMVETNTVEGIKSDDHQQQIAEQQDEEVKNEVGEPVLGSVDPELFRGVEMERTTKNRIKVYIHDGDKHVWDDIGTGHVECLTTEPQEHYIHFRWEGGEYRCCNWKVQKGMNFTKQQETLIIFIPMDAQFETALSFQSSDGAELFWKKLCARVGRNPEDIYIEEEESVHSSDDENMSSLPPLKIVTLNEIENFCSVGQKTPAIKEKIAETIVRSNWLGDLKNIYDITTDLEDTFSLALISRIIRNIIMLNRDDIVEFLFDNSNFETVLQMLSYIPNEKVPTDHIDFVYNKAKWKQVIRIQNKTTIEKIEHAFRVQYLIDTCLPPKLAPAIAAEDSWAEAAEKYLSTLRHQILSGLLVEEHFENDLIAALSSNNTNICHRRNLIRFLYEFFEMTDCCAITVAKSKILEALFNMDITRITKPCLVSNDYITRKTTMDVLLQIARYNVKDVLDYINDDSFSCLPTEPFILTEIINLIAYDPDPEVSLGLMVTQLLRILIGQEDQPIDYPIQRQQFVGLFFKRSFRALLQPLLQGVRNGQLVDDSYGTSRKSALILFFVAYCIRRHPASTRVHLTSSDVLHAITISLSSKHSFLVLSACKLIKTIVMSKDDLFIRHLVSANVLSIALSTFFAKYVHSNNMYNSAFLDFFDYIAKNDQKVLLKYVMDNFGNKIENLTYCTTFDLLRLRFKQLRYCVNVCNPDTPESLPDKDADFSDCEESVTMSASSIAVKDADFKPRISPEREEEGIFIGKGQIRPPTPITKRIVLKIPRRTAEQESETLTVQPFSLSFAENLEPTRLVDYDDSDQENSDKEDNTDTSTTKENNVAAPEQRGRKRKASLENEEEPDTASQPKRITATNKAGTAV